MAVPDSPMNIKARTLKENRLRKAKAEKQIINRSSATPAATSGSRAPTTRTCSDVQVGIRDIPAIFRIVRVAMALTPECSDEALDRLVAATVESYHKDSIFQPQFMTSFADFLATFNSDRGKRGRQFEHFVKWFLTNDPEWATQVDESC